MKKMWAVLLAVGMLGLGMETVAYADETAKETEVVSEKTEKEESHDFRNADWGMSKEEIKELEGDPLYEEESGLLYSGTAAGKDVNIIFSFDDDKLISGVYTFIEEHTNKNKYYDDYWDLVDIYSKKYGDPDIQKEIWSNDLYKDDPTNIGMAISVGHVMFVSRWEIEETSIGVLLNGDNFEVDVTAIYKDETHEEKINTDGI